MTWLLYNLADIPRCYWSHYRSQIINYTSYIDILNKYPADKIFILTFQRVNDINPIVFSTIILDDITHHIDVHETHTILNTNIDKYIIDKLAEFDLDYEIKIF